MNAHEVRVHAWKQGSDVDEKAGLLGWVEAELGDVLVDGIAVRRSAKGRLILAFPKRKAGNGALHSIVRPVDDEARREIEAAIFWQLGEMPEFVP